MTDQGYTRPLPHSQPKVGTVSRYWRLLAATGFSTVALIGSEQLAFPQIKPGWEALPNVAMKGGLKVFWNVEDRAGDDNKTGAIKHGFAPLTILGTYADYPGKDKEHIGRFLGSKNHNPWHKPPYFERIIRRNIDMAGSSGTFVNDIEIDFDENLAKVFADPALRAASEANDLAAFKTAYYKEWATWYWLPLQWTKERYPKTQVGLYGAQPFRSDFWGIVGKDAKQIDGTHQNDWLMWQWIDPYVDFYAISTYAYYAQPDSILYMAANIEENYLRTRPLGNKPVYAYQWLRYHSGNPRENNREVDAYIAEAMAAVPYFSGAKAAVLWGFEPDLKAGGGHPYETLPIYMKALQRVAGLSEKIGQGRLEIDEPAAKLWNAKRPLVRRIVVSPGACVVMAINPWQSDGDTSTTKVTCGKHPVEVTMSGRHTALYDIDNGNVTPH